MVRIDTPEAVADYLGLPPAKPACGTPVPHAEACEPFPDDGPAEFPDDSDVAPKPVPKPRKRKPR